VRLSKVFLALLLMALASEAYAQLCSVSAVAVNFGNYDSSSPSPLNSTGAISVNCSPPAVTVVKLDPGKNSGGSFNPRRMAGEGSYLNYNLCIDAACTQIWGDGTSSTYTQPGAANLTVYGRIPALQKVKPAVYGDSVTITVEW